jgi:hypothetical protein
MILPLWLFSLSMMPISYDYWWWLFIDYAIIDIIDYFIITLLIISFHYCYFITPCWHWYFIIDYADYYITPLLLILRHAISHYFHYYAITLHYWCHYYWYAIIDTLFTPLLLLDIIDITLLTLLILRHYIDYFIDYYTLLRHWYWLLLLTLRHWLLIIIIFIIIERIAIIDYWLLRWHYATPLRHYCHYATPHYADIIDIDYAMPLMIDYLTLLIPLLIIDIISHYYAIDYWHYWHYYCHYWYIDYYADIIHYFH